MIVKVQTSVAGNARSAGSRVLVYDETRKYTYEGDITPEIKRLLNGRSKAFFVATFDGKELIVEDDAPWQQW